MLRSLSILLLAGALIALPFVFRRDEAKVAGDALELTIVTSHNEAIRYEFGRAFSAWHEQKYGRPVRIDWRAIGGTTEIMRYLGSEYVTAARAWWTSTKGGGWVAGAGDALLDPRFDTVHAPTNGPETVARWRAIANLHRSFRETDDPRLFTIQVDLLFGGGEYDHTLAHGQGLTVVPWQSGEEPRGLFTLADGTPAIPERIGGEIWRTPWLFGNAAGTFGICYNLDRLRDLGVTNPPARWADLANPVFFRQVGIADPTKSGSIAKAFELIVHQQCHEAVHAAGFTDAQIADFETRIAAAKRPAGVMPDGVPQAYQDAIERGWVAGLGLLQRIGANARYFTDSGSKVPLDVGTGNAAAGLCIDFYGRFEAQHTRGPRGEERMAFVMPEGGSSASADPISLLRGAPHRDVALRFLEFVLGEDGQKLWCYRPGEPGGPEKYALRRIPIRRDFFPSTNAAIQARHEEHRRHASDNLADPRIDPYVVAANFTYQQRWTTRHFSVLRELVRAMCIDSAAELQRAWPAAASDPARLAKLSALPDDPEPFTWASSLGLTKKYDRLELLDRWTRFYRTRYTEVADGP